MTAAYTWILFAFLFISTAAVAQDDFSPLSKDASRCRKMVEEATARFNKDVSTLKGEHKKYLSEIYKERFENIKGILEGKEIITDQQACSYLGSLADALIKANPVLKASDLRIVFSNDITPNASSQGEGTILFHIGLFNRLQNESEAAFVLCHELAHYYLDHSNKSIEGYVNTVYSDEFQQKLKNIKKTEYGKNKQLIDLGKSLTFRTRKHSREYEQAADSLALEFMKHTGYHLEGATTVLNFLDTVENNKYYCKLDLAKHFHSDQFPFRKSWLEADNVLAFTSSEETDKSIADSLKTHPDCAIRIEKMRGMISQYNKPSNKKFLVSETEFRALQKKFDFNLVEYCFEMDAVSLCLYYTLQMLQTYPENAYLHTMVGRCLNEIYTRQKNHRLNQVTELPGSEHDENYNQLLQMIQNTRLKEIASLSYHYLLQHKAIAEKHKGFSAVMLKSMEHFTQH